MSACPSAATLARLGLDSSRGEPLLTLEGHIAGCAECQAALNRLVRNDAAEETSPDLPARDEWPAIPGFVIERELGRGSMGVVYLARQPSLGRLVALKVVRSGPAAGSREYARWLREGRSFSMLRHENVVRLHDVGEAGGWLYLVLEFIPGGTLNDRLDVPYSPRDAAWLLAAIADAVEAIHRAGLLHLDLKPSNILMDAPPGVPPARAIPRVGDFGLAYRWDDPDATSNTIGPAGPVGTPRYMAPEQVGADRDRLGPAADVYGLGALLYHAITGRPPFAAPSVAETLDQVRGQDPVPPRRLNPAIPRDLETICLKCLRKEPGHRYASAQAVADDLGRFLDGVAIAARPASIAGRTWRWCRRRPAVAALTAALATALCSGFLGMFLLWRHAESQRGRAERERARAEEAQRRAEAEDERSAELLGELIEQGVGGAGNLPRLLSPARRIELLRMARRHLLELASHRPDPAVTLRQLRPLELRLCETYFELGRLDEVRRLIEGSLRESEAALIRSPRAPWAMRWQLQNLEFLAELADQEDRADDFEALLRRAIAQAEGLHRVEPGAATLLMPSPTRRRLARSLAGRGRRDEAAAVLLAARRALEETPPGQVDARFAAERFIIEMETHDLGLDPPPGRPCGDPSSSYPSIRLASPEGDRLPAAEWAALALRGLAPDPTASDHETAAAHSFGQWLHRVANDQRRRGRLDLARRTADRLGALARLLVERHPDDALAFCVLADADEEIAKNAWKVDDRAVIRDALTRAIASSRRAVDLAPQDELARNQLERRERKLDDLLHPR